MESRLWQILLHIMHLEKIMIQYESLGLWTSQLRSERNRFQCAMRSLIFASKPRSSGA